jgi:hypothetical protein
LKSTTLYLPVVTAPAIVRVAPLTLILPPVSVPMNVRQLPVDAGAAVQVRHDEHEVGVRRREGEIRRRAAVDGERAAVIKAEGR